MCLNSNRLNLHGSGPGIYIFNMPSPVDWDVSSPQTTAHTGPYNDPGITDQIQHMHFTDEQTKAQRHDIQRYEHITAGNTDFLKNIYTQHKNQRYAFKIYKSGFTYIGTL